MKQRISNLCGSGCRELRPACLLPPPLLHLLSLLSLCVHLGFSRVLNTINYGELIEPLFLVYEETET